jgi:anti-sigma factor RsiW
MLSAKPAVWLEGLARKLYFLLRMDRLNLNAKLLQSAPAWMGRLRNQVSTLFANIGDSYREVNLFAVLSIAVIGMLIGMSLGGGGQLATESVASQGNVDLQAVQAHVFYNGEGRPVLETDPEKQQQLLTRLSDRAGKDIHLVDFSELGYRNAGMTLVPSVDGFSLITVYENKQSQSLTLSIGLDDATGAADIHCTAPGEAANNHKSICGWANGKLRFVVVSDLVLAETQQLAEWMKQNYSMAHLISSNEYFFSQTLGTTKA